MTGRFRCGTGTSIDWGNAPVIARCWCSGLLFELDLIAQGDAVGARHGDLRLQPGPAAINSTAVHGHQAEAAALVETQRIKVVVRGDYPQAHAPLLPGQLPGSLDQRGTRTTPLLIGVESEDLALPPVVRRHVGEHGQQAPAGGLGDKRRMIQGMNQLSQAGRPETVVPGKERLGSSPVGGLPLSDLHRTNITGREKGTMVLPARTFRGRRRPAGTPAAARADVPGRHQRWPAEAEPVIFRSRLKAQKKVAGIVLAAGVQDVAEGLDVAFQERFVMVHYRGPALLGADHLDQVAQEAGAPGAVKGGEHVRFQRMRDAGSQVAVLGQHPGCQDEHLLEARRPGLDLQYLYLPSRLLSTITHPPIMPPAGTGLRPDAVHKPGSPRS